MIITINSLKMIFQAQCNFSGPLTFSPESDEKISPNICVALKSVLVLLIKDLEKLKSVTIEEKIRKTASWFSLFFSPFSITSFACSFVFSYYFEWFLI